MSQEQEVPRRVFAADGLSRAQRRGSACASCGKRWPRPQRPVGRLQNGDVLLVCDDCAPEAESEPDSHHAHAA
ncbi:hypothetical protein LO762_01225 [Actinocorallia sp. API 0066]|uniref:hypothetical protein n=1 Tax=Actinocorallia sp. API 0066 TaxID=2896846 RepID=UPI001E5EAB3C|nr:hypothetical protein [Actinocorallia sp. API 0066]MCD0447821.1 hypothetical protein [Actinocorallia sp. API 0066]